MSTRHFPLGTSGVLGCKTCYDFYLEVWECTSYPLNEGLQFIFTMMDGPKRDILVDTAVCEESQEMTQVS